MRLNRFDGLMLIRIVCLIGGIIMIAHAISTPGNQPVWSLLGGIAAGSSLGLERFDR